MLLDKNGKLIKSLDFRGTKVEYLDKLSAKELFLIITAAQQAVNLKESFKAKDLAPKDWTKTVFQPIMTACRTTKTKEPTDEERGQALRLFGVIIKQALITTPLLFRQTTVDNPDGYYLYESTTYVRESLEF